MSEDVLSVGTPSLPSSMSETIDELSTSMGRLVAETVAEGPAVLADPVARHQTYFVPDSYIHLQAGDSVFRIHGYFFARESDEARALLDEAGSAEDTPLILQDVAAVDLERFCDVLYCGYVLF
jgi:hypothetical protein